MEPNVTPVISTQSISQGPPCSGISVSARGLRQEFEGGVVALDGIGLDVSAGEFLAVLGPSGCGKSTLLRIIAGLDKPTAGTIAVAGTEAVLPETGGRDPTIARDIHAGACHPIRRLRASSERSEGFPEPGTEKILRCAQDDGLKPSIHFQSPPPEYRDRGRDRAPRTGEHRAEVAYVFQDAHLLPWRTVLRNVALPLELMGVDRKARLETSGRAIEQVGLADAAGRYPNQLSGGMRMRVSLARAMVTDPRLLLLDEPFAALDEITRQQLDEQLRGLWAARGMTVVFVTHSTAEAAFLATRAVVMSPRPGRIVLDRKIELPASRDGLLRATPEFARETRFLYEALEQGTNHP